jgi:hypothetical protein
MISGPPAIWVRRKAPEISGMALSMSSAAGTSHSAEPVLAGALILWILIGLSLY